MDLPDEIKGKIEERILAAAAHLFSCGGYSGVSTREIASSAGVNEVTVYRHFPRKRDLYLAALAAELGGVHLRGHQLKEVAEATNAHQALTRVFTLIETALLGRPLVLPLLLYGALESTADVDALLRRHLGEFVEVVASYLDPWMERGMDEGKLFSRSARGLVMALVSIAVFRRSLERVFPSNPIATNAVEAFADLCTDAAASGTIGRPKAP